MKINNIKNWKSSLITIICGLSLGYVFDHKDRQLPYWLLILMPIILFLLIHVQLFYKTIILNKGFFKIVSMICFLKKENSFKYANIKHMYVYNIAGSNKGKNRWIQIQLYDTFKEYSYKLDSSYTDIELDALIEEFEQEISNIEIVRTNRHCNSIRKKRYGWKYYFMFWNWRTTFPYS